MRKFIFVLLITLIVAANVLALEGSGTETDPWRIRSLADFNDFTTDSNYWDDYTRLETDINLANINYTAALIASDVNNLNTYFDGVVFTGVFDGNGHLISNLSIKIQDTNNFYLGLFGKIDGNDAEIKNLGIENVSVRGFVVAGGLIGYNCGSITNCYSTGYVSGFGHLGGLVGENDCNITNCFSTCSVSGEIFYVGGLVGKNNGDIDKSYSTGLVNGIGYHAKYLGGLVGSNDDGSSITNSYSTCSVSGVHIVGGLVGTNSAEITNSYSTGQVNGYADIGGLVGENMTYGAINSCCSTGSVSGLSQRVGGLVGSNSDIIANSYSKGVVSGDIYVGGLVGSNYCSIISCYSTGLVEGISDDSEYLGGLVGYTDGIGSAISSYWDVETSGVGKEGDRNYGAFGRTTAQMHMKIYFPYYHWDFDTVWDICDGMNYPKLSWQIPLPGDFTCPDGVDFVDFAVLANTWNLATGEISYNDNCDLVDDDMIGFADLAIFIDHWLEGIE